MRLIDRYVGRHVAAATGVALAALMALMVFFALVEELGDVGKGRYGTLQAVQYVALTLPRYAYELLPVAALLGALAGLGLLAGHGELVAIRAAGVSLRRIVLSVLKTGLLIALAGVLVGELLAPLSEQYAQTQRALAVTERAALRTDTGFWARDGATFVHIRDLFPGGRLGGITIYEFDAGHRLRVASHARAASYREGEWVLEGIEQTLLEGDTVTTLSQARAVWETLLEPELLAVAVLDPEDLSAAGLLRYVSYLERNALDSSRYRLAFWRRVFQPLSTGVMMFLAVPVVFGPLRSAGGAARVVAGALAGFGFHVFDLTAGHVSLVYGLPPLAAAGLPSLAFLGAGLLLLRRVR